jgi:5-formyltetrahydrofolate cyclo-ligase
MTEAIENGMAKLSLETGETKESIREKVWTYLEKNNIAKFPRPVKKRIPNFEGAIQACDNLPGLEEFKAAQTIKVNPDKPQEQGRFLVLESGKTLVVTPLRRSARRNVLHKMEPPADASEKDLRTCSRYQGVKDYSTPVGFESKVKVDLVVVGCVAASKAGWRIGKGEGFADLEWAMMMSMGAVTENTIVVATCHDCQVLDLNESLFGSHDLTVDYILTPTQVIKCDKKPKPKSIMWNLLTEEKLERIPILKKLRFMERKAGMDTKLKDQTEDLVIQPGEEYVEPEEPEEDEDDDRRRNNRRRFLRNRQRRRPRSVENGDQLDGEDGEGGSPDNRKPTRRPRNNRRRGPPRRSEGDTEGGEEGEDAEKQRRPPRRRNQRRRRSQGSESRGEDEDGENDKENKNRPPRRRNYRRGPRKNTGDRSGEEGAAGDSESGEGRKRGPPRRRNRTGNGPLPAVYVGNLPRGLRVSEFKLKFREQNVNPLRVTWRGQLGYSYLVFESMDEVDNAMKILSGMSINDREMRVELANRTQQRQTGDNPGPATNETADSA